MISSIYVITCCVNQKRYVGFTKHKPHVRWNEHRRHCMTEKAEKAKPLYRAMRKYGLDNFHFEVIYQSKDHNHTKFVMEGYFIRLLNTLIENRNGYNCTHGGEGNGIPRFGADNHFYGKTHTEETRDRIRKAAMGRKASDEAKASMAKAQTGRRHTPESLAKMSIAQATMEYLVVFPDGSVEKISNLAAFCKERGLLQSEMSRAARGVVKSHRGIKVQILSENP